MGLAASQARLLSITARLSDNELHSQQISNSKVRLADKTQEASQEYIQALNATKLMYTTYNAQGESTQTELTPAIMYEYSELKNQYGISNASGQLLISSTDAMNFESSADVNEFVQEYGVALTTNPQFIASLESIFGSNYSEFYDIDADKALVDFGGMNIQNWVSQPNSGMSEQQYNSWAQGASAVPVTGKESGSYGSLIAELTNPPAYPGDEPKEPEKVDMPDFAALATAYNKSVCYSAVNSTKDGIGHMEHNLAALLWYENGLGTETKKITNSDGTITITNIESACGTRNGFSLTNYNFSDTGQAAPLLKALREVSDYECVQELIQSIIDLYCDVINYLNTNSQGTRTTEIDNKAFTINTTANVKTENELYTAWQQFYKDLAGLKEKGEAEYNEKYQEKYNEFKKQHEEWAAKWNDIYSWQTSCNELYTKYMDDIANLPTSKIPDEEDPKTGWYVNLWHRLNGESDRKSAEGEKGTYYKQLDDNLLTSSSWLQFALTHGVVTLEKVQYVDEAEDDTGLKTTKWMATAYSSCTDISETEDEIAVARAEAEYNQKLRDIESKDKKYDNDLKKLDTEHNALQTEYDSVKSVIEKNTERSFKAFS